MKVQAEDGQVVGVAWLDGYQCDQRCRVVRRLELAIDLKIHKSVFRGAPNIPSELTSATFVKRMFPLDVGAQRLRQFFKILIRLGVSKC